MRNKRFLILATALLLAVPAVAQSQWRPEDHLEPEASVLGGAGFLSGYDELVRDVLHDAYDRDIEVRMVAMPSFIPEYAVGLRGGKTVGKGDFKMTTRGAPYRIFVLAPHVQIWTYESIADLKRGMANAPDRKRQQAQIAKLQSGIPDDPRNVKIDRCEADISDLLGNRIVAVWRKILLNTRYATQYQGGADGATYHFAAFVPNAGTLAGQVWSPPRDSSTGTLVTLADTMRAVCEKRAAMSELDQLTTELEQRLQKGEGR